jgi:hypothetical protein
MAVRFKLDLKKEFERSAEEKKDSEAHKIVQALRDHTPVDTGRARDGWAYRDGAIVNDVEYISELNSGSSKQAPSHFIEKTLLANNHVTPNGTLVVSN